MHRTTCLLILLALPLSLTAQETRRTYQVEVVVFEQSGATAEMLLIPERNGDSPADGIAPEGGETEAPGIDALPDPASEPELQADFSGPIDAFQLEGIRRRLESGGYRVLWHQAWTQKASERSTAQATPLPMLAALGRGPANPGLEGSVSLTAGYYLHLGLELSLPAGETGDHTLSQRRRVKINELNYYDHPRIGAITLVTVPENQPTP